MTHDYLTPEQRARFKEVAEIDRKAELAFFFFRGAVAAVLLGVAFGLGYWAGRAGL